VRCNLCCIWHHIECVSVQKSETKLVWTCFECRDLAPTVKRLAKEIKEMKDTQMQMIEILREISQQLESETRRRAEAEKQSAETRTQLTALATQLAEKQLCANGQAQVTPPIPSQDETPYVNPIAPPMPSLLLGTSLLRNVDPKKVENWEIIAKGGAKLENLHKEINELPEDKSFDRIVIIGGSIDLEQKSDKDIVQDYQALVVSASTKANEVIISSILPRTDKDFKSKSIQVNEELKAMCERDGTKFVDNDPSFHLLNGDINEAHLAGDGLHLTKRGVDCLMRNCGVLQNGSAFTPARYPKAENSDKLLFRGHKDPLSNFFEVTITVRGQQFFSTEAAYQYSKAESMGDHHRAEKIQHATTGLHAMRIAEKIETDERWRNIKVKVMESLLKEKLKVCEPAKTALLRSGAREIVEDTTHEFWGRGKTGNGENMMGKIWMELRKSLRKDPSLFGRASPHRRNWATRQQQPRCYNCGETGHGMRQCRKRELVSCWSCGLAGHKSKHCQYYNSRTSRNTH